MAAFYTERFHAAIKVINEHARRSNTKLIFSTSRPSRDFMTPDFRDSFDLLLCGVLASRADEETMGIEGAFGMDPYQFIVKENERGA